MQHRSGTNAFRARRLSGVSLIESVLYVSVVLGLVVGGLSLFEQASVTERSASQARFLASVIAETRALYDKPDQFVALASGGGALPQTAQIDATLLSAGSIAITNINRSAPANRFGWSSPIRHEWGGAMNILAGRRDGHQPHILIYLEDIPAEVCIRISSLSESGKGVFADRVTEIDFQVPNGTGFALTSLPSPESPLPVMPDELARADHCGKAGGRLNVIYWVPLE